MKAQVRLFALAKQLARQEAIDVDLPDKPTVADLREAIAAQHPALAHLVRHAMFAIDTEFANDAKTIPPSAEIACIPPVSGG